VHIAESRGDKDTDFTGFGGVHISYQLSVIKKWSDNHLIFQAPAVALILGANSLHYSARLGGSAPNRVGLLYIKYYWE